MNVSDFFSSLVILIAAIFSIGTSSIGIQCYTDPDNKGYLPESNKTFMIVNLVSAILVLLSAFSMMFASFST